jgi:hypothetical protein
LFSTDEKEEEVVEAERKFRVDMAVGLGNRARGH